MCKILLIVMYGRSGTGKNYLTRKIIHDLGPSGFEVKRPSTRPKRADKDDDYVFISEEEFAADVESGDIVLPAVFNNWRYGIFKGISVGARDKEGIHIVVVDRGTAKGLKEYLSTTIDGDMMFLEVKSPIYTIYDRLKERGDNPDEVDRRVAADTKDEEDIPFTPDRVYINGGFIFEQRQNYRELMSILYRKLEENKK